jgi:hypothetical protein
MVLPDGSTGWRRACHGRERARSSANCGEHEWRETRRENSMKSKMCKLGSIVGAGALLVGAVQLAPVSAQGDGTSFPVDTFSQLQIEGAGHAIITIGSPASVTVSGPESEISNLQVQVWFNTLEIEPNDDDNRAAGADLIYQITVPSLSQIELEGAVTAEVDGLTVDSLQISVEDSAGLQITNLSTQRLDAQVEGNTSVSITGSAASQQLEVEDNAAYDAIQVDSASVEIEAQDASHSKVRFGDSLSGEVEDGAILEYMTESGSVSVSTEDGGRVTALPFEALSS